MKLLIRPDADSAAETVAVLVSAQLRGKPDSVLGLATGRTMERVYAALVREHRRGRLGFAGATSFNLDEYVGIAPEDPRSYRAFMDAHLFRHVDLPPHRRHLPDGMATDHAAEGARYEALIRAAGGIDLQLLGIGGTGHIGFNEPLSSFASRTRAVVLAPRTRQQNRGDFGGDADAVPPRAITMGVATIGESRRAVLLATGSAKAEILALAVEGPITASISATALQMHPDCLVIADEDAAGRLRGRSYYDHLARHDPELAMLSGDAGG
ncbi:glucosamine-6-phosphate deaminase [Acetobacteraceae bacterium KSS12]|uniref:Glucosamine-6-phosphate deaminase n=1 Tax=Rhizosaccharibacter radicis TaxID=2782605 RepID=A0ABT1VTT0_9PROT|nr:glucosamine-6-phosphate deaminase [Acetobacteraceae bacterium KSS12]